MGKQDWYSTIINKLLLGAAGVAVIGVLLSGCMKQGDEPKFVPASKTIEAESAVSAGKGEGKAAPDAADRTKVAATVTRVIDGDTIEVLIGTKKETVRMVLVDTPETKHPTKPVQPFGPEASAFTKETLGGKKVKLEKDVSERDSYGRLLRYVWLDDQMVNEMLLERGLARLAIFQPDVKYVDPFRDIQKKAQQAELGIWSIENYAKADGYHPEVVKTSSPAKEAVSEATSYPNCAAVWAAGKAPLHRGDPGYSSKLDGDHDGVACE